MHRSTWTILVAFSIIKYPKDEKGFKSNNDILNHNMLLSKIFSECTINFEQWRFSSVLPTVTGVIYLNSYLRELVTVLTAAERLHGSRSGVVTISCKDLDPSRPGLKHANFACEGNALSVKKLEDGEQIMVHTRINIDILIIIMIVILYLTKLGFLMHVFANCIHRLIDCLQ